MRFSAIASVALLGLASLVSTSPVNSVAAGGRLPDGLPFPSRKQLKKIEKKARGTLPNMPLPDEISEEGIVSLQLIAFNENMEVAFFTELLKNITNDVPGYHISDERDRDFAIMSLTAIQGVSTYSSCKYGRDLADSPNSKKSFTFSVPTALSSMSESSRFFHVNMNSLSRATWRPSSSSPR